jgi:hypothetical protein
MCALILPTPPTNAEYQKVEERFNYDLINSCYGCNSVALIAQYVQQVSNVESHIKEKKRVSKFEKLKKLGLIGSLNDTDVTSMNYKESLYSDEDNKDKN